GFVGCVAFDLYAQVLKEAIDARKLGKPSKEVQPFNPEVLVSVDGYIPETYIYDEKQKIDMYKRFQSLESQDEMDDLEEELVDRFGDYPNEVDELFCVTSLKILAKRERVEQIKESKSRIECLVE